MISDAANVFTAVFTGGTLLLAFLAYRAQQAASAPAFFVQVLPYDNAVSLTVSVRNRNDHPMRVVSLECTTQGVKLANWRATGGNFVNSIDVPHDDLPIDRALSSKGQDGDQSVVFDGVLVSNTALPAGIVIKLHYDIVGDGRKKSLNRRVPLSQNDRALLDPDHPPEIETD